MALARKTSRNPKQRSWEYQQLKKAQKDKFEREEQRYNNLCGPITITKIQDPNGHQ